MPKQDDGLQQLAQIMQLAQMAQAPQDAQQRQALALMELQQRAQERSAQAQYQQQALAQGAAQAAALQQYQQKALAQRAQIGQDRNAMELVQAQMNRGEPVNWDIVPEPMRSAYRKQQAEAFQQQVQLAQPLAESVFNGPAVKDMDSMTQLMTAFANAKIRTTPELLAALDLSRANPYPGYKETPGAQAIATLPPDAAALVQATQQKRAQMEAARNAVTAKQQQQFAVDRTLQEQAPMAYPQWANDTYTGTFGDWFKSLLK